MPAGALNRTMFVNSRAFRRSFLFRQPRWCVQVVDLVYSVCTLLNAESVDHATPEGFEVDDAPPPSGRWRQHRQGWRILPQDADTDGMVMIRYRQAP